MKNIVICCDGTSNQIEGSATNVRKLSWILERDDPATQVVFYDPGVGTFAPEGAASPLQKRLYLIGGLAFGTGFQSNLADAYRCLMHTYEPEDRIFLFGFSRGAFTVRALAGMLHQFGLLPPHLDNLVPYVTRMYTAANFQAGKQVRTRFARHRRVETHFLGLWDTVSSLGFAYARRALPYTARNPSVLAVRHAIAVDERRAYFRQNRWYGEGDVVQLWFPGVHCDVGGGYREDESGLSKIALQWMVDEATPQPYGLLVDEKSYNAVVLDQSRFFAAPTVEGRRHRSLRSWWWLLEFLPMNGTLARFRFSLPFGRRRKLVEGDKLHRSVEERSERTGYWPRNLRKSLPKPAAGADREDVAPWLKGRITVAAAFVLAIWLLGPLVADVASAVWSGVSRAYGSGWLAPVIPLLVVWLGANMIDTWTEMYRVNKSFRRRLPHLQLKAYTAPQLRSLLRLLGPDGRKAYRKSLAWDYVLAAAYGGALAWGFVQLRSIALPEATIWLVALPVFTVVVDWIENALLRGRIAEYDRDSGSLSSTRVHLASMATRVKLLGFTASILLLLGMLLWSYLAWPGRVGSM